MRLRSVTKLLTFGLWLCLAGLTIGRAREAALAEALISYPANAVALLAAASAAMLLSVWVLLFVGEPVHLWQRAAFGFLFFGPAAACFVLLLEIDRQAHVPPAYVLVNLYAYIGLVVVLGIVALAAGIRALLRRSRG